MMLELVIFDADGVLFDSTESNTSYYNAIFAQMGEPPMNPEEEKAGVFMAAPQVFELRARSDAAKFEREEGKFEKYFSEKPGTGS